MVENKIVSICKVNTAVVQGSVVRKYAHKIGMSSLGS